MSQNETQVTAVNNELTPQEKETKRINDALLKMMEMIHNNNQAISDVSFGLEALKEAVNTTTTNLCKSIETIANARRARGNDSEEESESKIAHFQVENIFIQEKIIEQLLSQKVFVQLHKLAQDNLEFGEKKQKIGQGLFFTGGVTKKLKSYDAVNQCLKSFNAVFTNRAFDKKDLRQGAGKIFNFLTEINDDNKPDPEASVYAWNMVMRTLTSSDEDGKIPGFTAGVPEELKNEIRSRINKGAHSEKFNQKDNFNASNNDSRIKNNVNKKGFQNNNNNSNNIGLKPKCYKFNRRFGCRDNNCPRAHSCVKCGRNHGLQQCSDASTYEKEAIHQQNYGQQVAQVHQNHNQPQH
jgi:hypothetical protein